MATQYHQVQDAQWHIDKATRNENFYQAHNMSSMDSSTFNEWALVVLFYTVMHYIDAVLSQDTLLSDDMRDPENHLTRNQAVSNCTNMTVPARRIYMGLYHRSIDARYKTICFPDDFIQRQETTRFNPLKQYLRSQLGL